MLLIAGALLLAYPARGGVSGRTSLQLAPSHSLPIPAYEIFDASGNLVRQVRLPADTRLVGFGKGVVYLARKDADDLEYLERYRL